jgi:hypothetical protein
MTLIGEETAVSRRLEAATTRVRRLSKVFIAWNAVFFVISLAAVPSIADDAVVPVLLRGAVFTGAGFFLVLLARRMRQGQRSGWFRLTLISVLAPMGVTAFIVFSADLPLWFVAGQLGSAMMLVGIAAANLQKDVRKAFPKVAAESGAEALRQPGRPASDGGHRLADGSLSADHADAVLGPGHGGVEQLTGEQPGVGGR